jgi:ABC-type transport system involved in multi-copper enzyme maturation permease subunit
MIAPPPLPEPPAGTAPNLKHAFGGVWRLTWRQVFAPSRWLMGGMLLVGFGLLSGLALGHDRAGGFEQWAEGFYLMVLVPIAAFLSGAGAVRDDMKPGTVDYVLTRPIPRSAFVVFRYFSQLACVQGIGLLAFVMLLAAAAYWKLPELAAVAAPILLAQIMAIAAFLALGFLCAALTSRYLVLGLFYGVVIEVGVGQIPIQLNRLSILHHLRTLVSGESGIGFAATGAGSAVGLLLLITVVLVAAAAFVFAMRELTGDQPKDA